MSFFYPQVSRECSSQERDSLRESFNRGEIDVMLLSPVCKQSYDLLDCSAIILLEVPDSQGAEGQIVSRILRSAAARKRPDMVVKLIRMMAVFPQQDPDETELKRLWADLADLSGIPRAELERTSMDKEGNPIEPIRVVRDLREQFEAIGFTADEIRAKRNLDKNSRLYRLDLVLKAASIPYGNTPAQFEKELQLLFADRLPAIAT